MPQAPPLAAGLLLLHFCLCYGLSALSCSDGKGVDGGALRVGGARARDTSTSENKGTRVPSWHFQSSSKLVWGSMCEKEQLLCAHGCIAVLCSDAN